MYFTHGIKHEKPVARILSSKGHEVFLPLYAVTHGGKTEPSDSVCRCFPVMSSSGVGWTPNSKSPVRLEYFTIVGWAGHPATVPDRTDRTDTPNGREQLFASSRIPI